MLTSVLRPSPAPVAPPRPPGLPVWPVAALFAGFPLWWLLGLGALIWVPAGAVMLALLVRQGGVRVPRGFGVYLLFLVWMLASVIEVDSGSRLVGFAYRALLYAGAGVLALYAYNCSERELPLRRVAGYLLVFWLTVVAGGCLGALRPHGSFTTPVELLLPHSLTSNAFVYSLVHPNFAQLGLTHSTTPRPSAPFPYTNQWGANYALLIPFVVVVLMRLHGRRRALLGAVLAASLVPAALTGNRGMLLALAAGGVYAAARSGRHWSRRTIATAVLSLVVVIGAALAVGVGHQVASRVHSTDTNSTRLALYRETVSRTADSPLLGFGAPRPSQTRPAGPSVGTQGQLWTLLFSHGVPGAALFVWFFALVAWRSRRVRGEAFAVHLVLLVTLLLLPLYGIQVSELSVAMLAAGLALRQGRPPEPVPAVAVEPVPAALAAAP